MLYWEYISDKDDSKKYNNKFSMCHLSTFLSVPSLNYPFVLLSTSICISSCLFDCLYTLTLYLSTNLLITCLFV